MKGQKIIIPLVSAIVGGCIALSISRLEIGKPHSSADQTLATPVAQKVYYSQTFQGDSNHSDFTVAAEKTIDAVVHVKTSYTRDEGYTFGNPLFDFFFGPQQGTPKPIMASGSGVILSADGYIVTNNHVIERAEHIEVVLNDKRIFQAKLVGRDPSTDIALLKIEATNLPSIPFGNSDNVRVGEWVLAIGNPFNLSSTVTAGIISAKARNIRIIDDKYAIESFIQTDAAVNPGNSGGALVNLKGELIGINTAIASQTGTYSGYSFAVPVSIAKKIVTDLMEFGEVQRAIMGVTITELTEELAKKHDIEQIKGVYVEDVMNKGAAYNAGIRKGDVILSINNVEVNTVSQLQEQVGKFRPNETVAVVVGRGNQSKHYNVTLTNLKGGLSFMSSSTMLDDLGAHFQTVPEKLKQRLGIAGGVQVTDIAAGKIRNSGIKRDFVITRIDRQPVQNIDDMKRIVGQAEGAVLVEGIYPNGISAAYALAIN